MNIPSELKYSKSHEWIKIENNIATIGVTDFAQGELGDVVFVEVNKDAEVQMDDPIGTIEAVKTVADIFFFFSGKVIEANKKLSDSPELVNKDPYGEGWLAKLEIKDTSEVNSLLDDKAYKTLIGQ
jgi:glycine cleavage system H protein